MSLGIYTTTSPDSVISSGSFINPIQIVLDSRQAATSETLYYIRSNNGMYTNITLTPVAIATGKNLINNGSYAWKLKEGIIQPTPEEWESISAGNTISFDDIVDIVTYSPFWLYVSIPKGANVNSYQHISLRISCEEMI